MGSAPSNLESVPIRSASVRPAPNEINFDSYDLLDNEKLYANLKDNLKKLELAFKYLLDLKDVSNIVKDKRALKTFLFMSELSFLDNFRESREQYDLVLKYNMAQVFANLLSVCKSDLKTFLIQNEYLNDPNKSNDSNFKSLKVKYLFVSYLTNFIWNLTEFSRTFRQEFHSKNGTKCLITDYLGDLELVKNCLRLKLQPNKSNSDFTLVGLHFLRSLNGTCHNLSKIADNNKKDWEEMNATTILMKFVELTKNYSNVRLTAYMTIANIVNDKEIETLNETHTVMNEIIKIIGMCADLIESNDLRRAKIDFNDETNIYAEAAVVIYEQSQYNIIELLEALYKLSINDKIKSEIYNEFDKNQALKKIIMKGNEIEKEYSIRLLYQLCFDGKVCDKMFEYDKQLCEYLIKYKKNKDNKNKAIKKSISGILWLHSKFTPASYVFKSLDILNGTDNKKRRAKKSNNKDIELKDKEKNENNNLALEDNFANFRFKRVMSPEKTEDENLEEGYYDEDDEIISSPRVQTGHIMISYNRENRDLCLKIKKELENEGFKIWIDIEDIHGSSLESMANAIENSICVLVCMTEKYKQSPNCRAEAEYTFNLRKPMVPLIFQNNYMPDGWLGIILGSKIFVNFTKYSFEECMIRLKKEIANATGDQAEVKKSQTNLKQPNGEKNKPGVKKISEWSNQDVIDWLGKNEFNSNIKSQLNLFNGELLMQLHNISKEAPEYFYNRLNQNEKIDLFSIVKFTNELNKLFL